MTKACCDRGLIGLQCECETQEGNLVGNFYHGMEVIHPEGDVFSKTEFSYVEGPVEVFRPATAEEIDAYIDVLETALKRILEGAQNQGPFSGISWRDVEVICKDALGPDGDPESGFPDAKVDNIRDI